MIKTNSYLRIGTIPKSSTRTNIFPWCSELCNLLHWQNSTVSGGTLYTLPKLLPTFLDEDEVAEDITYKTHKSL